MPGWLALLAVGLALGGEELADDDPFAPLHSMALCEDLGALEAPAMAGRLGPATRDCLELRYAIAQRGDVRSFEYRADPAGRPVTRALPGGVEHRWAEMDRISRLLLTNAFAAGLDGDWGRLLERHLREVDPGEPELCLAYARWLWSQGPANAAAVVRYAGRALENRAELAERGREARVEEATRLRDEAMREMAKGGP